MLTTGSAEVSSVCELILSVEDLNYLWVRKLSQFLFQFFMGEETESHRPINKRHSGNDDCEKYLWQWICSRS